MSVGYYAQEHEGISAGVTVLDHMRGSAAGPMPDTELRALLGMFGVSGDMAFQDAGTLSGGEKTKLALAQLVAGRHNLLLLDEPTNNLDPPSREAIGQALAAWPGAMVLVSHDAGVRERAGAGRGAAHARRDRRLRGATTCSTWCRWRRGAALRTTPRTTVRRKRDRAVYDAETVFAILDEALICHVGFVVDGSPRVIPTTHARIGEVLYLHGAPANFMLGTLGEGPGLEACITVTLIDALVLARSANHHSLNYRSVCVFGHASVVADREEKLAALHALIEHVAPGREADARPPNEPELRGVLVLRVPIDEASAKVRTGPPLDDDADLELAMWAGLVPLHTVAGDPLPAPDLRAGIATPGYATRFGRP